MLSHFVCPSVSVCLCFSLSHIYKQVSVFHDKVAFEEYAVSLNALVYLGKHGRLVGLEKRYQVPGN